MPQLVDRNIEDIYAHKPNNLQQVFRLSADVDIGRFSAAWEDVVSQNAILHARSIVTRSLILQVVLRKNIDWQAAVNLQEYLDHDSTVAFDYATRLVRIGLVLDQDGAHYFLWTSHHSTYDGHFGMLDMLEECFNFKITERTLQREISCV
ncbi:hypothetical protein BOTNAR_0112g00120 [Botryotinia narcissicola]|uniref:Condensation domain-containing protein n=1 Tax=Botryotinia narcissicola TaxID=278944 RepID=A0A4Z1IST1_9HELO|nr:hypothetical protein BOTNAR_0112g00120 [Botryotinia narcissicola]